MAKKSSSRQYQITGVIKTQEGKVVPKLSIYAFDQDPSGENLLGKAQTNAQGSYTITYTDENFRIEGKESGGADIIVRVFEGETLLKETAPLRNADRAVRVDVILDQPEGGPVLTPKQLLRLNNLGQALGDKQLRKDFESIFSAAEGNWKVALDTLKTKPAFEEPLVQKLVFAHEIAELTDDHTSLVQAFSANKKINSLRDVALNYNTGNLKELVKKNGIPEEAGDTAEEKLEQYTHKINTRLFALEPTATLLRMVADPAETPIADKVISGTIATFLGNQPTSFNIKSTSIYEAFKVEDAFKDIGPELQGNIVTQLKSLQRVATLSPVPEAMPVLMKANLTSALRVSEMPEQQFIQALAKDLGTNGEAVARQIYSNAVSNRIRSEQALIALKEVGQGTGVAFIDQSLQTIEAIPTEMDEVERRSSEDFATTLEKHNLSWDLLFGDADFCECGECTSVYSAAAYFVDLLQYLRNNNLDPDATGALSINPDPKNIAGTPLAALFNRRPDLGCLELTCKNTNTILPYIDLVNEVMENYLVYHHTKAFNVEEDQTSGELLAQPQYTEYEAYCILHKVVYPFTLPYHQPIDAARIYLDYLGTSRHELIDVFRSPRKEKLEPPIDEEIRTATPATTEAEKQELDQLHQAYLDRAVDAEFLGLTQEEYVILTQEAFVSKTYWDKQCKKEHSKEEYQQKIGVKPVHQYYGYATAAALLDIDEASKQGLTFVKDQFLRRTGVTYLELVELLKTQCLNPNMPKGKALSLLQSIQFSYRYLQTLVVAGAGTPKGKYEKLIQFLKENQGLIPLLEAMIHPDPCKESKLDFCVETKELEQWVYCYFERIGKIIVLENGTKCNCPEGQFFVRNEDGYISKYIGTRFPDDMEMDDNFVYLHDCKIVIRIDDNYNAEIIRTIGELDPQTGKITLYYPDGRVLEEQYYNQLVFNSRANQRGYVQSGYLYQEQFRQEPQIWACSMSVSDDCDLDPVRLVHLDGTSLTLEEYDQIQRFIRLWRKLGWSINEVDKALVGLSKADGACTDELLPGTDDCNDDCNELFEGAEDCESSAETGEDCFDSSSTTICTCSITPDFLHQLVAVKKLLDKTGLELIKLLTFWTDISTAGEKSLYKRLFLTHNLIRVDEVLKADKNGNYLSKTAKISEHLPILMAAFNFLAEDIAAIMEAKPIEDKLTLANLSCFYRYRLLSKVLGLKIPDFLAILPLFSDPFKSAHVTLEFMERWGKMEDAGFNYRQLNYLIKHHDDPKKPLAPTQKTILQLAKNLYDGINAIEGAHKDLNTDEEVTLETLRAKTVLLFDASVVEKIAGIVEGSNPFTTNAPKNLNSVSDKLDGKKDNPATPVAAVVISLRKKLKYNPTLGNIQVTSILTLAEKTEYLTWSNDPKWAEALLRIEKQQSKLFKEVGFDIFEHEKQQSPERKTLVEAAENTLKAGDISISFEELTEGEEDPNTAPKKRKAFLQVFLPYLREQLTHGFIVDALSGIVGLERAVTNVLITEVLKQGASLTPIYNIFEAIKEKAAPTTSNWSGYLIPASDSTYTFIVKDSDNAPSISIEGQALNFTQQEDPTNEWWSAAQKLQAGKLYQLSLSSIELKTLYWKTPASAIASIPVAQLLPAFASENTAPALIALKKAAMLVLGFNLSADEVGYLHANSADFGGLDFNQFLLQHWLRLEAYTRLRNSLPQTQTNLLKLFKWMHQPDDASKLSTKIAELTLWKKERVDKLIAETHFNLNHPNDFLNEVNLLKLQKALQVADKVGMDIDLLFKWAKPSSNFKKCRAIAENIQKAIRAQYKQEDWEQVIKPLNDRLRENQKNALIAYLLQQPDLISWGVTDADGLFEYFLIDVQMDACMETSRIKQALSSVQLFVQRCFLGLEEAQNGIAPDLLDRGRWEWMERYRVWEANRKVFLYPENWIESNLRDDKSPFFKELESELLQKDINKQNVADALKNYLYKVDEVANMEVVGLYIDGTRTSNPDGTARWSKGAKLHVFSRTRNAPYFFYYRYLDLDEMNWYPWEKMQVDIPSYDLENNSGIGNGCYLTPVVWNGRLLIFFPQIAKKTKPNPSIRSAGTFMQMANDPAGVENTAPIEYFEIKMAWSEYRNKKWTQKQLSTNALSVDMIVGRGIDQFNFIPKIAEYEVVIHIEDLVANDLATFTGFTFSGSMIEATTNVGVIQPTIPTSIQTEFGGMTSFQKVNGAIQSRQLQGGAWGNDDATFTMTSNRVNLDYSNASIYQPFFHDSTKAFLSLINTGSFKDLFNFYQGAGTSTLADSFGLFDHDNDPLSPPIYHELKRAYSLYNWELCLHTPMMLADALSKAQQFEEAMKWHHFVFNPLASGTDAKRFWQFMPFKVIDSQRILDQIFNHLKPNKSDVAINEWRNHPFMPHLVARSRPVAYMKWVVMKYIDNLMLWADYLYHQDTIESINQATQLYVLAGHILGPQPQMISKRGEIQPKTYLSLLDKWDAFSNAMTELEIVAPFSNQITTPVGSSNGVVGFANVFGFASSLYFCIPNNPKLMGYWDTLADRLFKIRHCQNIEGVFRKLPLFEPPIDPGLLVNAAAQGLSIASVLNDLSTPMPNYRFYYLLQKALELCTELKYFGGTILSTLEKNDNETIALIRAKHEIVMYNLVMEIKKQQLDEAQKSLESLQQNRKGPEERMKYYLKLSGLDDSLVPAAGAEFNGLTNEIVTVEGDSGLKLIPFEKEDMDKGGEAQDLQKAIGVIEALASIFHIIPAVEPKASPFGVGVGAVVFAGSMLANAAQAVGKGIQVRSGELLFASSQAGKKAGFTRSLQERTQQASAAGYEIKQIDKQITAQQIRINIANQEITNQQKQINNAQEVEEFLKNKYSNEELYTWMRGSLKTLYHQVYNLAYELAKKAEKVYRFERGLSNSNFIQAGYWNTGRDGLMAGEQLYVGLKQLEAAYQENRGYDYEITKHISLRQINPLAVLQLKETGKCEFVLPEVLFDMDYPGHYKRRIKAVSISIPCIAGPYTGLNGTLRLLENKFRNSALAKDKTDYLEKTEESDERFSTYILPITSIAASSAQNDSGMFELNFKDERYLPFEGAGAISKWRMELPAFRQFDYDTISDMVLQLRYVANEGGERLKKAAADTVLQFIKQNEELGQQEGLFAVIDLKHDLPNQWHLAMQVNAGATERVLAIPKVQNFLPFYVLMGTDGKPRAMDKIRVTDVVLLTPADLQASELFVGQDGNETPFAGAAPMGGNSKTFAIRGEELKVGDWTLAIKNVDKVLDKAMLVLRFVLK